MEERCSYLGGRGLVVRYTVHVEVVGDDVGHSLSVGGRARSAAPDGVMHLCQFVGDSVGDVSTSGCSAVGTENNTIFEVDSHTDRIVNGLFRDGQCPRVPAQLTSRYPS